MIVEWTIHHRHWEGDDWAGQWVTDAPDKIGVGVVVGYVHTGQKTVAIVQSGESLFEMDLEDLRVRDGEPIL